MTGGVDTHAGTHVAAALDGIGGLLGVREFAATPAGYARLPGWLQGFGTVGRPAGPGDANRFLWVLDGNEVAMSVYRRAGFMSTDHRQPLVARPGRTEERLYLNLGLSRMRHTRQSPHPTSP